MFSDYLKVTANFVWSDMTLKHKIYSVHHCLNICTTDHTSSFSFTERNPFIHQRQDVSSLGHDDITI
jgi:hypothetical protein